MQDIEAIVSQEPEGKRLELRLWLRLLSCNNIISAHIRKRLREEFKFTLPRFDVLAQLQRSPEGLRLGELSQRMMVTGGNLTGIVEALAADGYIRREQLPSDRRSVMVRLSKSGEKAFAKMALAHEKWLKELFCGMTPEEIGSMTRELDTLKKSIRLERKTAS